MAKDMDFKIPSEKELHALPKETLEMLYMQLAASFKLLSEQNAKIIEQNEKQLRQIENLQENFRILQNYRFGRRTEKSRDIFEGQMVLDLNGDLLVLNEAEQIADQTKDNEPTAEDLLQAAIVLAEKRKRKPGVRETDLRFANREIKEYRLTDEELKELFPEGYKEIGHRVSHRVEYEPAKLTVYEEHIYKYKSVTRNKFVYADHPTHLLSHGLLTPSLAAKIITDKFIYAIPYNRVAKEFGWMDMIIRPPTMARWMIDLDKRYFSLLVGRMKLKLKESRLIHCDETPFVCEEDRKKEGRTKNSKSYMWVFYTTELYGAPTIFLYEYRDNRRTENVERFLEGYHGIIMADGYEPYHTVARNSNGDIVVAGCYAHAKRRFAEIIKADPKNAIGTVAYEGNKRIAEIYHIDNKMKDALPEERLAYRKEKVAPLVDDLFSWAKERVDKTATEHTRAALNYLINQEAYLRKFLTDGIIPLDNSAAERSIRAFCVGKHNWHIVASSRGADSSGHLYSIAETAKANGLKPYEYFKYLLDQFLAHENDISDEFLDGLLPWSPSLPEELKKKV